MNSTGKLVILGILTIALALAAASWWFRYAATHRAARFWGPRSARLIRDAPVVELHHVTPPTAIARSPNGFGQLLEEAAVRDVSKAPGLTHLRNALLEDRSFQWPPRPMQRNYLWSWFLSFRNGLDGERAVLFFSPDWTHVGTLDRNEIVSCQPIAKGLAEVLGEFAPAIGESPR